MAEETCIICDEETGMAGIGEDSICGILRVNLPDFNLRDGDFIQPLCVHCKDCLEIIGVIIEE